MFQQPLPIPNYRIGGISSSELHTDWAGYPSPQEALRVAEVAARLWKGATIDWSAAYVCHTSLSGIWHPQLKSTDGILVSVGVDNRGMPNCLRLEPDGNVFDFYGRICFGDERGGKLDLRTRRPSI